MDMRSWREAVIASPAKQALPILSFPAIQEMGITVRELIGSAERQADAMRLIARAFPTAASVSFGSRIVVSDEEVPTVVGALIDEDTDLGEVAVPYVGAGRTGLYLEAIRRVAPEIDDRPVLAGMIGPFSLAGRLMDVNEVMVLCYEEPDLVHGVLERATSFLTEYARAFKEAGADGLVVAEPLAGLLSPDLLGEFSTPYVRRIVDAVQDDGFLVVYHNCGPSVVKAAEAVVGTGAQAFHFGNAVDMADILPLMPPDALVMGNVDPAGELRNGTPESVRERTLAVLGACAGHPNFVISSGCDIPPLTPYDNIRAFFAAVDEFYGR